MTNDERAGAQTSQILLRNNLQRDLYRGVRRGADNTHADHCTLVFDTDISNVKLRNSKQAASALSTAKQRMDIADYLSQSGQATGHRELRRLLRTLFKGDSDNTQ